MPLQITWEPPDIIYSYIYTYIYINNEEGDAAVILDNRILSKAQIL